jgi:hypothetical protein
MKNLVAAVCGSLLMVGAWSHQPATALTPQQELMKSCNGKAGEQKLSGDARKSFMKTCLSSKPAALTPQQELMKSCNAKAAAQSLKGDARQQFMTTCLKG